MYNNSKDLNKILNRTNWGTITSLMIYKTTIKDVNPKNTSKRCPRCGMINTPNRDTYRCERCGLIANRQLVGAINIYMKSLGLPLKALDKLPNRLTISLDESWVYGFKYTPQPTILHRGLSPVRWDRFYPVGGGVL